jgi:hypothetical protein
VTASIVWAANQEARPHGSTPRSPAPSSGELPALLPGFFRHPRRSATSPFVGDLLSPTLSLCRFLKIQNPHPPLDVGFVKMASPRGFEPRFLP